MFFPVRSCLDDVRRAQGGASGGGVGVGTDQGATTPRFSAVQDARGNVSVVLHTVDAGSGVEELRPLGHGDSELFEQSAVLDAGSPAPGRSGSTMEKWAAGVAYGTYYEKEDLVCLIVSRRVTRRRTNDPRLPKCPAKRGTHGPITPQGARAKMAAAKPAMADEARLWGEWELRGVRGRAAG